LIGRDHQMMPLWSFQGATGSRPRLESRPVAGLSKLNSVRRQSQAINQMSRSTWI
jgi:hypothetical protein